MKFCFLIVLVLSLVSCSGLDKGKACGDRLGVVEYGTSRVKLLIADVDSCQGKVKKIVHKQEWEAETDRHTLQEYDGSRYLNRAVIDRTAEVSGQARKSLDQFKVTNVSGIATGIYRSLTTASLILANYGKIIQGDVRILTKLEEASMGLRSALANERPGGKFIVWDFGGNSMQFSVLSGKLSYPVIGYPGSTPIKESIIAYLGKKDSPNPIGENKRFEVEEYLLKKFFADLSKLKDIKDAKVVGIGGVHTKSITANLEILLGQTLEAKSYSRSQVDQLAQKLVSLKDEDVGSDYAAAQATNSLAVHSIMKHMGWERVTVSEQTLALGYIISKISKGTVPAIEKAQ